MATSNPFMPAVLGPDIQQRQLDMQRQQMLAQTLLAQGQEKPPGQMISGHYVPSSPFEGLAGALKTYMGFKAMEEIPKQQQELARALRSDTEQRFGIGQPGAGGGGVAQAYPVGQSGQPMQPPPQPPSQSQMPLLPGRSPQESMAVYMGVGPEAYFKMVGEQGFQKPMVVSEGGTVYDPMSRQPQFSAAKNGIQTMYGPNGPQAAAVPGYGAANAAIQGLEAGAVEGAKSQFDLVDVPDGRGGKIQMPRSQAVQALGAGPQAMPVGTPGSNQMGQVGAPSPAGGTLGTTISPEQRAAQEQFGDVRASANQMLSGIQALRQHKGFEGNYGLSGLIYNRPGGPSADAKALADQLMSQGWLQMRDKLRGTGAITDYESKKAEQAWSALNDPRISPKMARDQLDIIEKITRDGLQRAQSKAYGNGPAPGAAAGGRPSLTDIFGN
jgi:hypothetical protein